MAKTSKAELKATMLEAMARQRSPAQSRVLRGERAADKVLTGLMKKAGLETGALTKLKAQRERDFKAVAAEQRSKASKIAALSTGIAAAQATVMHAAARNGGFFTVPSVTLDTPVRITSRPFGILKSKTIKPFKSFAKFRTDREVEGQDTVTFFFEWQNKSRSIVQVDAVTFIAATGFMELAIDGGVLFHWGTMSSSVQIATGIKRDDIFVRESQSLRGDLLASNTPIIPFDGHESSVAFGEFNLTAMGQRVEPRETMRVEVSVVIESECGSGFRSQADFQSGALGVSCPLVVLRIHGLEGPFEPAFNAALPL